ncbi:MFS transporter [Caballeronia mineralivorans]|nr:MFS transporter [Caballeronia mineralivorans]
MLDGSRSSRALRGEYLNHAVGAMNSRTTTLAIDAAHLAARLDRLPSSMPIWKIVLILALGSFFEFYDNSGIPYVAPGMIKEGLFKPESLGPLSALHAISVSGFGTFVFASLIGLWAGTLFLSPLADRIGRKKAFTFALMMYGGCSAVMVFQTTGFGINIWRFLTGVGLGVQFSTIDAYLTELTPVHVRGKAFSLQQAFSYCSSPLAALLCWIMVLLSPLGLDGWRWVVLIGAAGSVFALSMRNGLPESPRWLARKGRIKEAEAVIAELEAKVEAAVAAPLKRPAPAVAEDLTEGSFKDIFAVGHLGRTIMLSVAQFSNGFGFYAFGAWIPMLLSARGVNFEHSLQYGFVITLSYPIGACVVSTFADKIERKWLVILSCLVMGLAMIAFSQASAPLALIASGVLFTLGSSCQSIAYHSYGPELFPTHVRARAVGFTFSWNRVSSAFAGLLIGILLHAGDVSLVAAFTASSMLLQVFVVGIFGPKTTGKSLEEINP